MHNTSHQMIQKHFIKQQITQEFYSDTLNFVDKTKIWIKNDHQYDDILFNMA